MHSPKCPLAEVSSHVATLDDNTLPARENFLPLRAHPFLHFLVARREAVG